MTGTGGSLLDFDINLLAVLIAFVGFLLLFAVLTGLIIWARRRSVGVIAVGAFMSIFSPDPTFEQKIKLVEEAKEIHSEEEDKGEP